MAGAQRPILARKRTPRPAWSAPWVAALRGLAWLKQAAIATELNDRLVTRKLVAIARPTDRFGIIAS